MARHRARLGEDLLGVTMGGKRKFGAGAALRDLNTTGRHSLVEVGDADAVGVDLDLVALGRSDRSADSELPEQDPETRRMLGIHAAHAHRRHGARLSGH